MAPALASPGSAPSSIAGKRRMKTAPSPGALSTWMSPPLWSTTPWAMARPSPVPSPTGLVVKKGSKARRRVSASIPSPESRTRSVT